MENKENLPTKDRFRLQELLIVLDSRMHLETLPFNSFKDTDNLLGPESNYFNRLREENKGTKHNFPLDGRTSLWRRGSEGGLEVFFLKPLPGILAID